MQGQASTLSGVEFVGEDEIHNTDFWSSIVYFQEQNAF